MHIRRLRPDDADVERFVTELWIPYHRDLSAAVADHAIVENDDLVDDVTTFTLDQLDSPDVYLWIAVDGASDPFARLAETDGTFAGFLLGAVEASPSTFTWPDRFVIGDVYVREDDRGTGLADRLVERAANQAREEGCSELALDVDRDNERALGFYEKLGFEPARHRMRLPVEEL